MKTLFLLFCSAVIVWADAHIFVYHRFNDDRYPSTNTTLEDLKRDFEYFKNNNYQVIPLSQLVKAIQDKKTIPDNWVVLTIDDNYKSFYEHGLKVFKEYEYPFTLFVFVEGTDRKFPDFTTWEELKEIAKYGSLAFHSYGHKHMTRMSNEEILKDFDKGMSLIKKNLGVRPKYFSYPFGEFSLRVKEVAKKYGFEAIFNQNMGAVNEHSDLYNIDRTALVGKSNLKHYLRYKYLDAKWEAPIAYPKDKILKKIKVLTKENAKNASYYISGHGWEKVNIENGIIDAQIDKKLKFKRSRVMLKIGNKITSKILIKDSYGTK